MLKLFKKQKNYPKHIAIIIDGNRRWAKKRGLLPWEGHRYGFEKVKELFEWAKKLNIKELTLYCFSIQNFQRSRLEIKFLINLFLKKAFLQILQDPRIHQYKIKLRFCGRLYLLPKKVQEAIKQLEKITKNYKSYTANFCLSYGGQEEIVEAVNKLKTKSLKLKDITKEMIEENLCIKNPPDIIIRTSGEYRTSNFLCWQQAYSEWFFIKKYWPDFTKADLVKIIKEYQKRDRRFGR